MDVRQDTSGYARAPAIENRTSGSDFNHRVLTTTSDKTPSLLRIEVIGLLLALTLVPVVGKAACDLAALAEMNPPTQKNSLKKLFTYFLERLNSVKATAVSVSIFLVASDLANAKR